MLSRVAASVYWMARYIERAENAARFIDVNLQMSLDSPITFSDQWQPLVAITGDLRSFQERYDEANRENVIQFLTLDKENPNSILSCLSKARENARSIREAISSETWEQVNRFYLMVSHRAAGRRALEGSTTFFSDVKLASHLVSGIADNTTSHGEAWHFMELGRLLERADNTSRMLDVKYFLLLPSVEDVGGAVDEMQWSVLLRSATAFEMYRKKYGPISPDNVVQFLLLDTEFPRAILFCLLHAESSLHAISGTIPGSYSNLAERRLGVLRSELAYAQVYDIITKGLHEFLDGLQTKLNGVGDAITQTFFTLQPAENGNSATAMGGPGGDVLSWNQSQGGSRRDRRFTGDLR
ncbi:MAG TPA: alpha-E domain-containing protein [Dehalococcoidia bacterium]|nr:alpha-E domain-containing protein [Dehalococcoidia bacterium]